MMTLKYLGITFLLCVLLFKIDVNAQNGKRMVFDFKKQFCSYYGENTPTKAIYTFSSDNEAKQALERIMKVTGLPTNFNIMAANVPNACAVIKCPTANTCERFILYNQDFMLKIRDLTQNNWSEISILSHEIGHHLSGHTLDNLGSRPEIELEADKFSGFVLGKMGAKLTDAKAAMELIGSSTGSNTHPAKDARIAAIVNGWREATANSTKSTTTPSTNTSSRSNTLGSKKSDDEVIQALADKAGRDLMSCCSSFGGSNFKTDVEFSMVQENDDNSRRIIPLTVSWTGSMSGRRYWIRGVLQWDKTSGQLFRYWKKSEDSGGFSPGCGTGCIEKNNP
jgi:hypothetical protein